MAKKKLSAKYQPPKADSSDTAHLVTKASLSFVPAAPDLFEYFVRPPLEKRLDNWREEVASALRYLEENKGIQLEELQNNPLFISIISQATSIAIRTHQKEKLDSLKNAVVNSAVSTRIDNDLQLTFIRFIDELTPSHLYLLKFFIKSEEEIKLLKSYPSIYQLASKNIADILSKDIFKMLIGDLSVRGLIHISQDIDDFEEIYQASSILMEETDDNLPRLIVTRIAKDFVDFIRKHE